MAEKQKSSVSFGVRYGYGLGEFGFNFLLTFITYYLMSFLTNAVGLSTVAAAAVTTATSIVKLVGMPIAGTLSEAVKFKNSTFRGWMLVGVCIFALGGTLLFLPIKGSDGALTVFYIAMFFVYWTGYCIMWTNHRGLMTKVAANPGDRVAVTAASSQLGTIARVVFSSVAAIIVGMFATENGVAGPGVTFTIKPIGWTVNNLVFGLIAIVCFLVVNAVTKKSDSVAVVAGAPKQAAPKMTGADIKNTFTKPMLIFVLCAIFRVAVLSVMGVLLNYYVMLVVGDLTIMQVYMVAVYALSFVGALLVTPLAKKIGKRNVFIYTTLLSAVAIFLLAVLPNTGMVFMVCMCAFQFLGVFSSTLIPVCMADIGEYNAIVKGAKAQGLTFSIGGFSLQLASVIGTAIGSFGLVAIKFDVTAVTADMISALKNLYIWGIGGLSVVAAVLFFLYPLTEDYMADLRAKKAAEAAPEA